MAFGHPTPETSTAMPTRTICLHHSLARHVQTYIPLGGPSTYLLSHLASEQNVDGHGVLQFFDDSETSLLSSSSDTDTTNADDFLFNKGLLDLLEIYDS